MHVVVGGSDGLGKKIIESLNSLGLETTNIARRNNSDAQQNILEDLSLRLAFEVQQKACKALKHP